MQPTSVPTRALNNPSMQPETPPRDRDAKRLLPSIPMRPGAIAFRDSLNSDALMQVVLQGIDNAKKTSKTGVPGAGAHRTAGKTD